MEKFCLIFVFVFVLPALHGQNSQIRSYFGLSYYMGDLSPSHKFYSISDGHFTYGISYGGNVSESFFMGVRFIKGNFSGDDRDSRDISRRRRNLHFESYIYELGFFTEFYINTLWKGLDQYGLKLYLSIGVNVFHFNPKTTYLGSTYALQRLMTEGQGSFNYPERKTYDLTQINFPFGFGVAFNISQRIGIGLEILPRLTTTDYLDDVSTTYINYRDLMDDKGELSAILANRTGEFLGTGPVDVPTGTIRGDPGHNDWYLYTGFYVSIAFGKSVHEEIPEEENL